MPLAFVLDENLRGVLYQAIRQHNAAGSDAIDAVQVGDPPDLPLGSKDPDILLWAEAHGRVLVTRDQGTMLVHLADHLRAGHHSPGVLLLRRNMTLGQVVSGLALVAHAADPALLRDRAEFVP
jgi:hypothetical protein